MKKINNYILEKLVITKDFKITHSKPEKGMKIRFDKEWLMPYLPKNKEDFIFTIEDFIDIKNTPLTIIKNFINNTECDEEAKKYFIKTIGIYQAGERDKYYLVVIKCDERPGEEYAFTYWNPKYMFYIK